MFLVTDSPPTLRGSQILNARTTRQLHGRPCQPISTLRAVGRATARSHSLSLTFSDHVGHRAAPGILRSRAL